MTIPVEFVLRGREYSVQELEAFYKFHVKAYRTPIEDLRQIERIIGDEDPMGLAWAVKRMTTALGSFTNDQSNMPRRDIVVKLCQKMKGRGIFWNKTLDLLVREGAMGWAVGPMGPQGMLDEMGTWAQGATGNEVLDVGENFFSGPLYAVMAEQMGDTEALWGIVELGLKHAPESAPEIFAGALKNSKIGYEARERILKSLIEVAENKLSDKKWIEARNAFRASLERLDASERELELLCSVAEARKDDFTGGRLSRLNTWGSAFIDWPRTRDAFLDVLARGQQTWSTVEAYLFFGGIMGLSGHEERVEMLLRGRGYTGANGQFVDRYLDHHLMNFLLERLLQKNQGIDVLELYMSYCDRIDRVPFSTKSLWIRVIGEGQLTESIAKRGLDFDDCPSIRRALAQSVAVTFPSIRERLLKSTDNIVLVELLKSSIEAQEFNALLAAVATKQPLVAGEILCTEIDARGSVRFPVQKNTLARILAGMGTHAKRTEIMRLLSNASSIDSGKPLPRTVRRVGR